MDSRKQEALKQPIRAGSALAGIAGEDFVLAIILAYKAGLERGRTAAADEE